MSLLLGLTRRGEYSAAIEDELDQLVAAIQVAFNGIAALASRGAAGNWRVDGQLTGVGAGTAARLKAASGLAHGMTAVSALATDTDDYLAIGRISAINGGATLVAIGENDSALTNALQLAVYGGQADTAKSTAGRALAEVYTAQHTGLNAIADIAANGNVWAVRGRRGGGNATFFLVDEDGDTWQDGTATATGFSGTITATAGGNVSWGVYTPTRVNVANLDSSTAYECQWLRVGNTVLVSGTVEADPTNTATSTQLRLSLPVASNIGAEADCGGAAFSSDTAGEGAGIVGDSANDAALMRWRSVGVANMSLHFTFAYQVI